MHGEKSGAFCACMHGGIQKLQAMRSGFALWLQVPVLIDGDRTLHDSWKIAEYLDSQYPDLPLLFFGDTGQPVCLTCLLGLMQVARLVLISPCTQGECAYRHSLRSKMLPQCDGKLMQCSVTRLRLVDMLVDTQTGWVGESIQRHLMLCRQGQCEAHRTDYQIHSKLGGS